MTDNLAALAQAAKDARKQYHDAANQTKRLREQSDRFTDEFVEAALRKEAADALANPDNEGYEDYDKKPVVAVNYYGTRPNSNEIDLRPMTLDHLLRSSPIDGKVTVTVTFSAEDLRRELTKYQGN